VTDDRPRLVLADDHHMLVDSLRAMLEGRYEVVAVAYSGRELLEVLARHRADCLLLDLGLPGRTGLELLPDIRRLQPGIKVLIVTMHVDRAVADAAIRAGADGFIPKDSGLAELREAIDAVLAGGSFVSARVPTTASRSELAASHPGLSLLTPRQESILRMIAEGRTTAEIADALGVSQRTVTFHRVNIRDKLGIADEHGLFRFATMWHDTEPPPPTSPYAAADPDG
jgi:DNA-binding NarL/FixJ family response regulator